MDADGLLMMCLVGGCWLVFPFSIEATTGSYETFKRIFEVDDFLGKQLIENKVCRTGIQLASSGIGFLGTVLFFENIGPSAKSVSPAISGALLFVGAAGLLFCLLWPYLHMRKRR